MNEALEIGLTGSAHDVGMLSGVPLQSVPGQSRQTPPQHQHRSAHTYRYSMRRAAPPSSQRAATERAIVYCMPEGTRPGHKHGACHPQKRFRAPTLTVPSMSQRLVNTSKQAVEE